MSRIFITGSADGLGRMAAQLLIQGGHSVVLHARNARRAEGALAETPGAASAILGDLSTLEGMTAVAQQANALGPFDGIIHNAALGYRESHRVETKDGLEQLFAVNTVSPYLLTALITPPKRLVYLSSGLHRSGRSVLGDLNWTSRPWNGLQAYSDSKLHDVLLAFAVARLWPKTFSNSVEPGWVATKMGGAGAPDDLRLGPVTQAWLAAGDEPSADVTGGHFYHQKRAETHPDAHRTDIQDGLLAACAQLTGTALPRR